MAGTRVISSSIVLLRLSWRRGDPDAAVGHAPVQHPCPLVRGYRVHTLLCRGSGLPVFFLLSPAHVHEAPFARPLLQWAIDIYHIRPRVIPLDAGYSCLQLIRLSPWCPGSRGRGACESQARNANGFCLPPTWTSSRVGKRTSIERFAGPGVPLPPGALLLSPGGLPSQCRSL